MICKKTIVSVVVTVYNVEKYIARCIESVLSQTYNDFELVIVDDCTPDKSMKIVEKYAQKDNRIKPIYLNENSGLMWARKVGYENSEGKYIVFLDSDDTLPNDAVELLYNAIESEDDLDMVSGNIIYKKIDGTEDVWRSYLEYGQDSVSVYKSLLKNRYRHNLCGHIIKKDLLVNFKYHSFKNFTKWEDYCLFYQLVANCRKVGHIDKPVYYYYQTQGSSTQVKISERSLETTAIAHKEALDVMTRYPELHSLIYQNFQYCFCSLYHNGYKNFAKHLDKNNLIYTMSNSNILKYNNIKQALKLLILKYF